MTSLHKDANTYEEKSTEIGSPSEIGSPYTDEVKRDTYIRKVFKDRVEYRKNGKKHRRNGPAVFNARRQEWWFEGKRHRGRDDSTSSPGPAIVILGDIQEWWVEGKRHREGNPAVKWFDGHEEWWVEGKRHRLDGPAMTDPHQGQEWWVDGKLHRFDGPAIIRYEDCVCESHHTEEWWRNGVLHRERGPAIVRSDGTVEWWKNGIRQKTFTEQKTEEMIATFQRLNDSLCDIWPGPEIHSESLRSEAKPTSETDSEVEPTSKEEITSEEKELEVKPTSDAHEEKNTSFKDRFTLGIKQFLEGKLGSNTEDFILDSDDDEEESRPNIRIGGYSGGYLRFFVEPKEIESPNRIVVPL